MKVFISGPMTGQENYNRPTFQMAEKRLKEMGYDIFNPAWLTVGEEWSRNDLLAIDLVALSKCDAICHLPGWMRSSGALAENQFAVASGKKHFEFTGTEVIIYDKD